MNDIKLTTIIMPDAYIYTVSVKIKNQDLCDLDVEIIRNLKSVIGINDVPASVQLSMLSTVFKSLEESGAKKVDKK